jgi:ATP-dependent DNA ligase
MNLLEMLEAIENAAQGNARLDKIKELDCKELRNLLHLTLSPDITFGIKKLPEPGKVTKVAHHTYQDWLDGLLFICERTSKRTLTGNAMMEEIDLFLNHCSPVQRKWAERILKRDLRLNIGAKDVNKKLPGAIKLFSVPLAESYEDVKSLEGLWTLQPKLDGARCVAFLPDPDDGPVVLKSRTGKIWQNFESVRKSLQEFNDSRKSHTPMYLDGEVISRIDGAINFQALQHNLHRKDGVETGILEYIVFDAANANEWLDPSLEYKLRCIGADGYVNTINKPNIRFVGSNLITNPTQEKLVEYCKVFVDKGYEGAMLRKADEPVVMKRSKKLLKVKMFKDLEAEVVGVVEGTGRLEGMLGAIKCKLPNGNEFECGSGFNDAQRAAYWKKKPIGEKANIKYFELTNDGVPRFPIFRAIRHKDDI